MKKLLDNIFYFTSTVAILALLFIIAGCASFVSPENEIRITEYGTQGTVVGAFTGEVGGCRVTQSGKVDAEVLYNGERCKVHALANQTTQNNGAK